ncbi:MAG: hypothetical protein ACXQT4_07185 [Methanotrichaceae archaeon]
MNENQRLGVTPMYESLAKKMKLKFVVVNPYHPDKDDVKMLKQLDLLVIAPGYEERVRDNYSGELIEAGVRTFSQLKESVKKIAETVNCFDEDKTKALLSEIDKLIAMYKDRTKSARAIKPLTPMIKQMVQDLDIPVNENGITAAPDYIKTDAQIQVPTHQPYDMDLIERIRERYDALLGGLKNR